MNQIVRTLFGYRLPAGSWCHGGILVAASAHSAGVLYVKFCKGGDGWLESCGLAEVDFLVLPEIVPIEMAVGFEPVLAGFDG